MVVNQTAKMVKLPSSLSPHLIDTVIIVGSWTLPWKKPISSNMLHIVISGLIWCLDLFSNTRIGPKLTSLVTLIIK